METNEIIETVEVVEEVVEPVIEEVVEEGLGWGLGQGLAAFVGTAILVAGGIVIYKKRKAIAAWAAKKAEKKAKTEKTETVEAEDVKVEVIKDPKVYVYNK